MFVTRTKADENFFKIRRPEIWNDSLCSGIKFSVCRPKKVIYEGENETYIEASVENSSSILYDKEIRNKPRTRRTKRNV